jgi:pimeloyl-ACP methyl ester carboxylesterase
VRVEDTLNGLVTLVPEGWEPIGSGVHARSGASDDPALIAAQSAPQPVSDLWPSLLPQFGLEEIPAVTAERTTPTFDWQIHEFEVIVGGTPVGIALATAELDGSSYLVLLQSSPDELAVLREAVFLPAVDALELLAPEPTPDPATLGYAVEEVTFPGGSEGVELAGTLTLPTGDGPHPVVVLMSGSGPQDRDESLRPAASIKPFALIADALTSAGVGVLRYDDRGVGGSTGDYGSATVADLTEDVRAALDYLATRGDVDQARLGLLGHSEGGIYAATLGADDPRVAFVVGMAAPAVEGIQLLVDQAEMIGRTSGTSEEVLATTTPLYAEAYRAALAGDAAATEEHLREAGGAYWDAQSEDVRVVLGEREAFIDRQVGAQLPTLMSEWFRSVLGSDPAADWSRVTVPVLALFGALDVQVPPAPNEDALREALEQARNDDVTVVTFPDANHLFQAAETGGLEEYGRLPDTFSADVLPTLVDWVVQRAGISEDGPSPAP